MAPRNPLKEDIKPQEVVDGGNIVNLTTQETVEVISEDGSTATIVTSEINSGKSSEGQYVRKRTTFVRVNPLGNSGTIAPATLCFSHSGVMITSPEQKATCISSFHKIPNRNILIGYDGTGTPNGPGICTNCRSLLNIIYIVLGILGIGIVVGLFRGLSGLN